MHWRQFEYLTAEYFRRNGYRVYDSAQAALMACIRCPCRKGPRLRWPRRSFSSNAKGRAILYEVEINDVKALVILMSRMKARPKG